MPTLDDLLLPVFLQQHGLVCARDVIAAGGARHQISTRLDSGRWQRVESGVYRLGGYPSSWHTRLLAPILSAGGTAMASHLSAAVLHGAPGYGLGVPEISVVRGTKLRRTGVRVHTSTDIDRCTRLLANGIPVTDPARTLLDLASTVGPQRLLRTAEWLRRNGKTTWSDILRTLVRHGRRGRPGVSRLRALVAANAHRDEITDSDLELLALVLLLERGLPEPALHHRVYDGARFVAEVDLAYPDLRIAIELDGGVHLERDVRERDLPRQNDLILLGWTVLRFTWDRLRRNPEAVIAEIRAARRASMAKHAA